jgi:hypothetical protein
MEATHRGPVSISIIMSNMATFVKSTSLRAVHAQGMCVLLYAHNKQVLNLLYKPQRKKIK